VKLVFVTGNDGKYRSFVNIASRIDVDVERRELDYPENHDLNSTRKIAMGGAEYCSEKLGEPVVVTDAGLFIEALDGFPGVSTGFTLDRIGNKGLLKLLEEKDDRSAVFRITLAFSDGETTEAFTSGTSGRIAERERGGGFGFDPIFAPEGHEATFGEKPELRDNVGPLNHAMEDAVEWLEKDY
jgi:XTP/dITP diphosphohydrolase